MDQVHPDRKYVVVSNSNVISEVQESQITSAEGTFTPVVKEKFDMDGSREVNKVAPPKFYIAFVVLMLLVLSLFLAVIALCIAFSLEIPKLKSETGSAEQQSSISAAIMDRLDNLNSSMDGLSQQLLQVIDSQTQQVASSLIQQFNSSLELLSQQLREDISAIDIRTQQINSSQQILSQELREDISVIDSRTQQINSSQQTLSQELREDISAINNRTQQINSSQQTLSQELQDDISDLDSRTQQINSSQQTLSQELRDDISDLDSRTQQINSSQQMFSQELRDDISDLNSRTQQINSSQQMLSQELREDISDLDSRTQQINSSQQTLSQELRDDVSAIDYRTQQINSSQQMLSQELREDISDLNSRTQQINSSQQTLSQNLQDDISAIDYRTQEINSSQQMLSQELREDISDLDSRTQQINSSQQMFSQELREDISAIDNRIELVNISLLQQVNDVQTQAQETVDGLEALGEFPTFPAASCAAILSSLPSGFYYVRASNGSAVRVYCDMTLSCGGVSGGWMRVVEVDFNDSSNPCPSGFGEDINSNLRTCVTENNSGGCYSTEYSTSNVTYSNVCGKVIAYQFGTPEAFSRLLVISSLGVSSQYLDGISLTHGNPMEHIWSFAVGVTETFTNRFGCPCNVGSTVSIMNTFIGTDYFCDSAAESISSGTFYPNNPLFDGEGCAATSDCCSFNNPPWFYKQLPQSTYDDIEMRVCRDESGTTEGVPFQSIELYVQ